MEILKWIINNFWFIALVLTFFTVWKVIRKSRDIASFFRNFFTKRNLIPLLLAVLITIIIVIVKNKLT